MKHTHTPGPWNLIGNGILLHPVTNAQLVTQRIETSLGSFEVLDETNEPEANARLIAAAPDLLSALETCVSELNQLAFIQKDKMAGVAIQKAFDAIAKAKGAA